MYKNDFIHHFQVSNTNTSADITIKCVGHACTSSAAYRWDGLHRGNDSAAIIQYGISGEGALRAGNSLTRILPGMAMLLTIPDDHCYYLPAHSKHWEFYYIVICGKTGIDIIKEIQNLTGTAVILKDAHSVMECIDIIMKKAEQHALSSPYLSAELAFRLLMKIADYVSGHSNFNPPEFPENIYAYVRTNPGASIDELVRESGYCRLYFDRIFKKHTGITPVQFLSEHRMERAIDFLAHTKMPIKEIADICGFHDSAYFCRIFRQKFNMSPTAMRNNKKTYNSDSSIL